MNIYQGASLAATFAVATATAAGLAASYGGYEGEIADYGKENAAILIITLFSVILKIKTGFDDHQHFGEVGTNRYRTRYAGFILATVSWIFWASSALMIFQPDKSAALLLCAIATSTLWIFVHLFELARSKASTEKPEEKIWTKMSRYLWLAFNAGYIVTLAMFSGIFPQWVGHGAVWVAIIFAALVVVDTVSDDPYKRSIT